MVGVDTARVMELYTPVVEGSGGQVGSGYRVGPEVVLTSAHVVAGLPAWPAGEPVPTDVGTPGVCWARPLREQGWVPAIVAWRDEEKDVAVLRLAKAGPPLPASSPPPRWGRVDGQEQVAVSAVGFPWAQERPDRVRDTEQLYGIIAPAAMAKAGLWAVTVVTAAPAARAGASPWAGMSGAALFAGPFLVGVVVVHPAHFGTDRGRSDPVAALLADAELARLLDTSTDSLVDVGPQLAPQYQAPTPWLGREQARATPVNTLLLPPVMVGRADELRLLRAAAQAVGTGGRPVAVVSVHGMGGAGKTALARSLAAEVAGAFPDTRIEVDLYGFTPGMRPREPGEMLEELLRLVGFAATDVPSTTEGRSQLWRSYLSNRRALLVLDNARNAAQVLPLLPGGGPGRCLVVVTSRNRLADLETAAMVEASVLPAEDAIALLVQASHQDPAQMRSARATLETLAALCGFLPLALRSVGSLLARLDPGELVEVMRSAQYPLQHLSQADRAAASAFGVSYEALTAPLQDTLRACAWHPGPDFDADSIAALASQPRPLVTVQLVELLDSNMLTKLPGPRYGFHDLFLGYARREADSHDEQLTVRAARQRLCARLLNRLETAASMIYTDNQRAIRREHDYANFTGRDQARAWLTAAADELTTAARAALADGLPESTSFAGTLAYWLHAEGKSDQPITLYEALHTAARLAGNQKGQADALAGLGLVAHARGEYQRARHAYRESRELYGQTGERRAQADAVKGLADVARVLGDHSEAEDGYRHAYDLYQETGDARGQADSLTGLGDMAYARGESRQAHDAFQQAHDLCDQIGYRSGQADALCGLGDVAMLDGEPDQARTVYQQAHDIYLDIGNVHGLAYAFKGLGDAARLRSDHQQAREWYARARDLYQQIGFRNYYADVLRGMGDVAHAEGDEEQADVLYRQAYDICEEIGYRSGQADALKALGDLANARKEDEHARDYYLRARDLYRQTGNLPGQTAIERALGDLSGTQRTP
jgi:tetratricopeptide (TPR) repeat protein